MFPKWDEKLAGQFRHLLNSIGVLLATFGWIDSSVWIAVVGIIMTILPFIWSWVAKDKEKT